MKTNRRWMKWVLEANADEITLPWARSGQRRKDFKTATGRRARAA